MSMPFIRLFPFLHTVLVVAVSTIIMSVNALYRAFSISTRLGIMPKHWQKCVNALYRAFSISTEFEPTVTNADDSVSMPFIGLFPFLRSPLGTP